VNNSDKVISIFSNQWEKQVDVPDSLKIIFSDHGSQSKFKGSASYFGSIDNTPINRASGKNISVNSDLHLHEIKGEQPYDGEMRQVPESDKIRREASSKDIRTPYEYSQQEEFKMSLMTQPRNRAQSIPFFTPLTRPLIHATTLDAI